MKFCSYHGQFVVSSRTTCVMVEIDEDSTLKSINYGLFHTFYPFICLYIDFKNFYYVTILKIKFEVVDKLNLILTNQILYDHFAAISDSLTGLNQTILASAAMLLLTDYTE